VTDGRRTANHTTTDNGHTATEPEHVYPYTDLDDRVLYEVVRRPPKNFKQRRPTPTGWTWDLDGITRIPYRWPHLHHATLHGLTAWVVEGEKDVERLISLGLTATTNAGGAAWPWPDEWAEHFRGLHQVIVIADNDDPGRSAARQRAKVIAQAVPDVRIIEALPGVPAKGDVSDWLDGDGTLEQLVELVEKAPTVGDLIQGHDDEISYIDRLRSHLLVGDAIRNLPPPKPLIGGLLDLNSLAALYGRSGAGKSFVAIDWALSVSTGSYWFGHQVIPGRSLYVVAEGATGVPQRVDAWQHARRTHDIGDIMWLPVPVDIFRADHAGDVTRFVRELAPSLIILDTLARSVPTADENSARDMSLVILHADRLRRATGACVLIVHHTGRDEARGMRGSTVLEAAMDTTLECRQSDDGAIDITATKQKNRESGERVRLALVRTLDSCVLEQWRGQDIEGLPPTAEHVLSTLHEIDLDNGTSLAAWSKSADLPDRTFRRWVRKLVDLNLVKMEGETTRKRFTVTIAGLQALGQLEPPEEF
jgi:hypothetical protein